MQRIVALSWTDVNNSESGYEVERRNDAVPGNPFVNVASLPTNSTGFDDLVDAPGDYSWRIRAVRFAEVSAWSNLFSLSVTEPLTVVTDLHGAAV